MSGKVIIPLKEIIFLDKLSISSLNERNFIKKTILNELVDYLSPELNLQMKEEINVSHLNLIFFTKYQNNIIFTFNEENTEKILKKNGLFDLNQYESMKEKCQRIGKNVVKGEKTDGKFEERPLKIVDALVPINRSVKRILGEANTSTKFVSNVTGFKLLHRLTVDVAAEACRTKDVKIQTTLNLPHNVWTQWKAQESDEFIETPLIDIEVLNKVINEVYNNTILKVYEHDYTQVKQFNVEILNKATICYKVEQDEENTN